MAKKKISNEKLSKNNIWHMETMLFRSGTNQSIMFVD